MSGPDRIFVGYAVGNRYWVPHPMAAAKGAEEYVRLDLSVLAALPEVQALIAGTYEAAAQLAGQTLAKWLDEADGAPLSQECCEKLAHTIRKRGEGKP